VPLSTLVFIQYVFVAMEEGPPCCCSSCASSPSRANSRYPPLPIVVTPGPKKRRSSVVRKHTDPVGQLICRLEGDHLCATSPEDLVPLMQEAALKLGDLDRLLKAAQVQEKVLNGRVEVERQLRIQAGDNFAQGKVHLNIKREMLKAAEDDIDVLRMRVKKAENELAEVNNWPLM
jgi:hypothetical protein